MKKQILSEEFKRMQKLAGLITESQGEDQVNDIKANFVKDKIRKMSPEEFILFLKSVGDYDFWKNAPEGIDPFNNIGQRMDILSTNTPEDNDRYFKTLKNKI